MTLCKLLNFSILLLLLLENGTINNTFLTDIAKIEWNMYAQCLIECLMNSWALMCIIVCPCMHKGPRILTEANTCFSKSSP